MLQARSLWPCLVTVLVAGVTVAAQARAEPMPKEACEAVGVEHAKLTEAGLPELVKKGPVWVKANLGEARMLEVARYIRLHEELMFQCGFDKLRALPGTEADEASTGQTAAAAPPPLPQRKPPVPENFQSRPIPAAASARAPGAASPRPLPKSRPKPKVDDAYRPPLKPSFPQ